jgi:hypothetical protein
MPTLDEKMDRLIFRQEELITAMHGLCESFEIGNTMLAELMAWLKQPPSDELPSLIRTLTIVLDEQREGFRTLPERLARAVKDGEV